LELVNRASTPVDLAGTQIEFARGQFVGKIPDDTLLAPSAYYAYYPIGYVAQAGEKVFVYSPNRTELWDSAEVKSRLIGRSLENGNSWFFPSAESPGAPNTFDFNRDVVINEIMCSHLANQTNASWIELVNHGTNAVDLSDWKISPVNFQFPKGVVIS